MNTRRELLEVYVEAKDVNRPTLILESFKPDAVLTYSIATDTISFPDKVLGADAIAQTLVRDFREKFDRCKTYYVCDSMVDFARQFDFVPWLVVMREVSSLALRVGKGHYRWQFNTDEERLRVSAMHIHIEKMEVIEDRGGKMLHSLQSALPYPWLAAAKLIETCVRMMKQTPDFSFLEAFKAPIGKKDRASRIAQ